MSPFSPLRPCGPIGPGGPISPLNLVVQVEESISSNTNYYMAAAPLLLFETYIQNVVSILLRCSKNLFTVTYLFTEGEYISEPPPQVFTLNVKLLFYVGFLSFAFAPVLPGRQAIMSGSVLYMPQLWLDYFF